MFKIICNFKYKNVIKNKYYINCFKNKKNKLHNKLKKNEKSKI